MATEQQRVKKDQRMACGSPRSPHLPDPGTIRVVSEQVHRVQAALRTMLVPDWHSTETARLRLGHRLVVEVRTTDWLMAYDEIMRDMQACHEAGHEKPVDYWVADMVERLEASGTVVTG